MRTLQNDKVLQRRYFLATTLTVTGLLMLLSSSLLLFIFPSSATTLPLLPLGSLTAIIGLRITNTWLRTPAPHNAIDDALKGLGKSATILHYYTPARHLLISEHGVFAITALPHPVKLRIQDDTWDLADSLLSALQLSLTYPPLRKPIAQARKNAQLATEWLSDRLPEATVEVTPLIAFTSPNIAIQIQGHPSVPITTTTKNRYPLKTAIRDTAAPTLSEHQLDQILQTL